MRCRHRADPARLLTSATSRYFESMRLRPLWVWRAALLGFAAAYLSSSGLQLWLPPLLPFLAAAAVEAQFFVAGLRANRRAGGAADPGPQRRDLEELGWPGEDDEEAPALEPSSSPHHGRASRTRMRLLQGLAVLALLAGLFFLDSSNEHWQHLASTARAATVAALDRQASRIAGHPATVICDVSGHHVGYVQDADGLAEVGGRRAWLTPQICYQLYLVTRHGNPAGAASGHAIAVLAHEAWHLHGERSEALANCFAYQSGVRVGEALGLATSTARRLMTEQLADNPSDYAATPQYVVPEGCRRGGSFDLHLDGRYFP